MCLCGQCLNPHNLYKALKKSVDTELPRSLSDYLCKHMKCGKELETNFYHLKCVLDQCPNGCKITDINHDLRGELKDNCKESYYVFERVDTHYFNSNGKKVMYKCTARVDKKNTSKKHCKDVAACSKVISASSFLHHRYYICNDMHYWKKFLENMQYYTIWMDYYQKIKFAEGKQVQSAHFSGKQHTLHNTVIIPPDNSEK